MEKTRTFRFLTALQLGAIGGAIALLLSLMGMVEAFGEKDIIAGVISLGDLIILAIILVFAGAAASRAKASSFVLQITAGAIVGMTAELMLVGLVVLGEAVNLRNVFPNASPGLYDILQLGRTPPLSYGVMLAMGAIGGVAGAILRSIPSRFQRPILVGISAVALLGLLEDLIRIVLSSSPNILDATRWMFASGVESGLTVVGAVVVFGVFAVASFFWGNVRSGAQGRVAAMPSGTRRGIVLGSYVVFIVLLLVLPRILGSYLSEVNNSVGLFLVMALGLNIVVGYAGLLDLGYVAFFAIGAYTMGVLTTTAIGPEAGQIVWGAGMTFWQALPFSIGATILAGVILGVPVLRMRGDYLAIVTLGFGEIVRIMALSDTLKPFIGGSQGIVEPAVPTIGTATLNTPQTLYYLILIAAAVAIFISVRLRDSRQGRSWMAMREDEDVAQAMGIHLVPTKLLAFATGAALAGLSGAIFASKVGSIYPHSMNLLVSINVLAIVIIGGMGSIPGVVAGALALYGLPELLREFSEYRYFVFGALLVAMMLFRPEGLWPEASRRRELHGTDEPEGELPAEAVAADGPVSGS